MFHPRFMTILVSTAFLTQFGAATAEPLTLTVIRAIAPSLMYFNDWSKDPIMNAEVTPWSLGTHRLGGLHWFLVPSINSYLCSTPSNMFALTKEENIKRDRCSLLETEDIFGNRGEASLGWKRDYYGAFSAHIIDDHLNQKMYLISQGEQKDERPNRGYNDMPGSSCSPAPDIGYGADASWSKIAGAPPMCDPAYEWPSYNAFILMSTMPYTKEALSGGRPFVTEYGPILWPSNGYIERSPDGAHWIKATDGGVRHPSSIVAGGYLYVFYDDLSQGQESEGRGPGIKVARAPISPDGVDPHSFETYFDDHFVDSALPRGLSLEHYAMWSSKGGRASSLFPSAVISVPPTPYTGQKTRRIGDMIFSVARVDGTDWFIGVANEFSLGVTLRISGDLLKWSAPIVIPGTESNYYSGAVDLQKDVPLLYARFANADGDSNTDIDPNDFYVIGTQTSFHDGARAKVVNAIRLAVSLPKRASLPETK